MITLQTRDFTKPDHPAALAWSNGLLQFRTWIQDQCPSRSAVLTALLFLLLVISFIPLALLGSDYHAYVEIALFIPRFVVSSFVIIFILMATVFHKKEHNALKASYAALRLINEQDFGNNPVL